MHLSVSPIDLGSTLRERFIGFPPVDIAVKADATKKVAGCFRHPTSGFSDLQMIEKTTSTNAVATEENYEFAAIPRTGKVNVANHSHDDEAKEHTYTVSMDDGRAVSCTCPSDKYHEEECKHREAVEEADVRPVDCRCDDFNGHSDLSCWPCARDGHETPATEAAR